MIVSKAWALEEPSVWLYRQPLLHKKQIELQYTNLSGSGKLNNLNNTLFRTGNSLLMSYKYGMDDDYSFGFTEKFYHHEAVQDATHGYSYRGYSDPVINLNFNTEGLIYGFNLATGLFNKEITKNNNIWNFNLFHGGFYLEPYMGYQFVYLDFIVGGAYHYLYQLNQKVKFTQNEIASILFLKGGHVSNLKLFTEYYWKYIWGLEFSQLEQQEAYFIETEERVLQAVGMYNFKIYSRIEIKNDLEIVPFLNLSFAKKSQTWSEYKEQDFGISLVYEMGSL